MQSSAWYLKPDIYTCISNERLVFLDLMQDRYFCLGREESRKLYPRIIQPADTTPPGDTAPDITAPFASAALIDDLIKRGILMSHPPDKRVGGKEEVITPCSINGRIKRARGNLLDEKRPQDAPLNSTDIWHFLVASATAGWLLRHRPIKAIVERVKSRKHTMNPADNSSHISASDLLRTIHIVSLFYRLRPFWQRDYLCLFDSLALVEFLHRYHLYAIWVFGVTVAPFAAHCWVQDEDFIYNDTCEAVRHYTPIMMV